MVNGRKVGLAIINYNSSEKIIENLSKIYNYEAIDNIVLVDNGSTDNSLDKINKNFLHIPKIEIISSKINGGWSYGYNIACKRLVKLNVFFIIVMTPAVNFSEKTLIHLCDFLNNNSEYPLVTCIARKKNGELSSARIGWQRPTYIQLFLESFLFLRGIVGKKYSCLLDINDNRSIIPTEVVGGSFYVIRAALLTQINYFDEDLFLYYEENVLSSKLNKIGYKYAAVLKEESYYCDRNYSVRKNITPYVSFKYLQESKYIYARKYLIKSKFKLYILKISICYALLEKKVQTFFIRGYRKHRI